PREDLYPSDTSAFTRGADAPRPPGSCDCDHQIDAAVREPGLPPPLPVLDRDRRAEPLVPPPRPPRASNPHDELPRRGRRRTGRDAPRQPDVELLLPQPRAGAARLVPVRRPGPHRLRALRQAAGVGLRLLAEVAGGRPRSAAGAPGPAREPDARPARLGRDDR